MPEYKIKNTNIREDEQQLIVKVLESLASAYSNDTLNSLIDKYNTIVEKEGGQKVFYDFSVTKENRQVQDLNGRLERAIQEKHFITFDYRNANGEAFYSMVHGNVEERMKESEQSYYKTCIQIEVEFEEKEKGLMEEYFPDCPMEPSDKMHWRILIHVPAKERLWKALLLSFGNRVKVVGPKDYQEELIQTAKDFIGNYDI